MKSFTVGIIGAGPIGIELAIALKQANISFIQFEKGQVAQMIYNFPPQTHFFSSTERIGLAGVPVQTLDQQKCTREEYLAYIRMLVASHNLKIQTFEEITEVKKNDKGFLLKNHFDEEYQVQFLILATGGTSNPRSLGVPGESLPHVSTKLMDPHLYFQKRVVVIGGKNSAVETALRCFQVGADVTLITRRKEFEEGSIKYWLMPELMSRIHKGEIKCIYNAEVEEIFPDSVLVESNGVITPILCDFVIKAIGFNCDLRLFKQLNIELEGSCEKPAYNPDTMETPVKGVYALGTVVGGTQKGYKVFIENSHAHVNKIMKDLTTKLGKSWTPFQERVPNHELES